TELSRGSPSAGDLPAGGGDESRVFAGIQPSGGRNGLGGNGDSCALWRTRPDRGRAIHRDRGTAGGGGSRVCTLDRGPPDRSDAARLRNRRAEGAVLARDSPG